VKLAKVSNAFGRTSGLSCHRARDLLLCAAGACNACRANWFGSGDAVVRKHCPYRCVHPPDDEPALHNQLHLFTSCKEYSKFYTKRHDKVVLYLQKVLQSWRKPPELDVHTFDDVIANVSGSENRGIPSYVVPSAVLDDAFAALAPGGGHLRSQACMDLICVSRPNNAVVLIEFQITADRHQRIAVSRHAKHMKYQWIVDAVNDAPGGWQCTLLCFSIGYRGTVHLAVLDAAVEALAPARVKSGNARRLLQAAAVKVWSMCIELAGIERAKIRAALCPA
jgi:hypothetical protein